MMTMNARSPKDSLFTAVFFIFSAAIALPVDSEQPQPGRIKPNVAAFDYARELVQQGRFVADGKGSWSRDHPSTEQENEFIRINGFAEYAKWHLGIDERHSVNSKARYKFPYGDFANIHRCGLLAVKSRAREYGYSDIEDAAAKLIEMISAKNSRR
jgi:hypothetical protein